MNRLKTSNLWDTHLHNPNDPSLSSWISVPENSDFPIQNLPFGVFSVSQNPLRVGVAIGEHVLDLSILYDEGFFNQDLMPFNVFALGNLNEFMACGRDAWRSVRSTVSELLSANNPKLRDNSSLRERVLISQNSVSMHIPVSVPSYVDFYSSEQHATNVGKMFRPDNPLMPNWKHIPIGYNGRASSVVVSGIDIHRPSGQILPPDSESPIFSACKNLDFELEVGFFNGKSTQLGSRISTAQANDHIFGLVLVNDWSARDIQRWEYQPLGPFLSKTFGTSISPWVVTLDALEPWRRSGPEQNPQVLDYLQYTGDWRIDLNLQITLQTEKMSKPQIISKTSFLNMYWNMAQQLAHQSVNGTNLQVGDLYASGTVSGDTPDSYGSMLELAWRGEKPLVMEETGEERKFLMDGDTVVMTGWCQGKGYRIGFGEVRGKILPTT